LESVLAGLTPAEAGVMVVSLATAFHQGKAPAAVSSLTPAASATPAQSTQVLEVDDDFSAATTLGQED